MGDVKIQKPVMTNLVVNVEIERTPPKFVVFKDKPPHELVEYAEKHKDVFVTTFLTGAVDDYRNYDYNLNCVPFETRCRIIRPVYIGCFTKENQEIVMREYLKKYIGCIENEVA